MFFKFDLEDELPEEKKAEEFFKDNYVYDLKGNTYIFEETTKSGYLCTEIYREQPSYYEPLADVIGETVLLKEIFSEPPIKRKAEEVVKLEKKINELNFTIKNLQEKKGNLERLTSKTPEEIITEKLKDLPNVNKFLEFLTQQKTPYTITETGSVLATKGLYIGINSEGNMRVFAPNGYEYYGYNKGKFYETKEEAEKASLKIILGNYKTKDYPFFVEKESLFEKYGEELPYDWHALKEKKRLCWIDYKKAEIEKTKKEMQLKQDKIDSLKQDIQVLEKGNLPSQDNLILPNFD